MSMSVTRSVVLLMCAIVHVFLATMKTLGPILWDGPEKKTKTHGQYRAIIGHRVIFFRRQHLKSIYTKGLLRAVKFIVFGMSLA